MNLDDLPAGSRVFVDANILLYMLGGRSVQCHRFLTRCDVGEVEGWITTSVLAEVGHRRMMMEAQVRGFVGSNPARALSQRRDRIRELSVYREEVQNLLGGGLEVEVIQPEDFLLALELQNQYGLLTNDALNLAVAFRLGISEIATADVHFDGIPDVVVCRPEDLM